AVTTTVPWTTLGEYLDFLDRLPKGLNAGGMVGHVAIRWHVMNEDSLGKAPASSEQVARMCELIEEAGRYGATESMEREYRALRSRLANGYRILQDELDSDSFGGPGFHGCNFELLFANYSLDLLVRGPGQRSLEMLTELWRAGQGAD
ncbi:MAG: hypothetical protein IIC73_07540, partial [Armatimonadetes bacterium]|nr:hypothetical protein [Armatimonadota bacterium]